MLGVLVYLDPARIDRADLGALVPEQARLRTVYVGTVRDASVRIVAFCESGERYVRCDHDITPVLGRIGCPGPGVERFATWAASPVALSATDNDLLRYRLGLPLVSPAALKPAYVPPPPTYPTGFEHDLTAMQLLAAVYADPSRDEARMVLADRLQELGDPRGEMIGLQLGRAWTDEPASERELELIQALGRSWTRPLSSLLAAYGFRRGFVATALIDDRVMYAPDVLSQPAWSTIEELETTNISIVTAPTLRSIRRLATDDGVLASLVDASRPIATIETIVGTSIMGQRGTVVQGGIRVPRSGTTRGLPRLRAMSLTGPPGDISRFLRSPLGRQLEHVEVFAGELDGLAPEAWREVSEIDRSVLSVRGFVGTCRVVIARQDGRTYVQLAGPAQPEADPIIGWVRMLGGHAPVTVEVVDRERSILARPLADVLARNFSDVSTGLAQRWRSP